MQMSIYKVLHGIHVYGGRELPLKILKFVGIIFVNFFLNFDLLLFFFYKIKASESEM